MKYTFSIAKLRPDLKEDVYRLDIKAEGSEIYEESWYLRRFDIEVLAAKLQVAIGVNILPIIKNNVTTATSTDE
jgi:hypothetical protein